MEKDGPIYVWRRSTRWDLRHVRVRPDIARPSFRDRGLRLGRGPVQLSGVRDRLRDRTAEISHLRIQPNSERGSRTRSLLRAQGRAPRARRLAVTHSTSDAAGSTEVPAISQRTRGPVPFGP